jgi:hypothetical protein
MELSESSEECGRTMVSSGSGLWIPQHHQNCQPVTCSMIVYQNEAGSSAVDSCGIENQGVIRTETMRQRPTEALLRCCHCRLSLFLLLEGPSSLQLLYPQRPGHWVCSPWLPLNMVSLDNGRDSGQGSLWDGFIFAFTLLQWHRFVLRSQRLLWCKLGG